MKFVADLHLHSKYSRAVSQNMTLPNMASWAAIKGINVIATGDFTHPFWFDELKKELKEEGNGLYKLKGKAGEIEGFDNFKLNTSDISFLLSCEISSIYSQGGKGRRIHNLFMFPSISSVEKFNKELVKRRINLRSDGRPIVGLSSRDLAEIALNCDRKCLIIPAHVWTPWFSLYGSFSGFDSIEECFADFSDNIFGIETGLSSDPLMNWNVGDLKDRAILSFSDAHSLEKMGREVTVFEAKEANYDSIYKAISKKNNENKIAFTVEFYPEEGKYHYTGHRNCEVSLSPQETNEKGETCPVCGKGLTVGVLHRVEDLRTEDMKMKIKEIGGLNWKYSTGGRPPYISLVPLMEIVAEAFSMGTGSKRVRDAYAALVNSFGSEFNVLLKADIDRIARIVGGNVSEAIKRVRTGNIVVEPGYDGVFGKVRIWDEEISSFDENKSQLNLF